MVAGDQLTAVFQTLSCAPDADAELMLRFQAGEAACFDALVARQRRPLLHYLFRMIGDLAVSEDLAQETFLRVYLARARYRREARFSTWLYRIATRLALNFLRDHRHQRRACSLDAPRGEDEGGWELPDRAPGVEARLVGDERRRRIQRAVAALPARQRAAVLMHKYQECDYREIAAVLRLSTSATKSLLFRAYETLRRELHDLGAERPVGWPARAAAAGAAGKEEG